ncbi:MAG: DUF4249 domain-containing protein [Bacteroidales bacterium]|nr:DUF4249 domain-containing protein [Bacteroidales bacterium]
MKTIDIFRISVFALAGMLYSCEKVIDLDLNTSSSQMVIQGNIYDQAGPYTVRISKSVGFDEPSIYPAVTGAIVTISDNAGNAEVLSEDSAGVYVTDLLQGLPGRTYTLRVEADGQIFTATAAMPPAVEIDSLYSEKSDFGNFKQIAVDFYDPANTTNYYRLVDFINGKKQENIMVASDMASEGKKISGTLMYEEDELKSGDTYTLWLECVDKGVYDYFRTAGTFNGHAASPSNPLSNISNGALGFFNVCSVRKKSIVLP